MISYLKTLPPNYLSAAKAAELLGCHRESVYRWVKKGSIECTRIGSRVTFSPRQLIAYLECRTTN